MYNIKLVDSSNEEAILDFEKRRLRNFGVKKEIKSLGESPFAKFIEKGDMLAFNLQDEDKKIIGGMLVGTMFDNVYIDRLFVEEEKRQAGAGTYMVNYVLKHKDFFEDYYGIEVPGVLVEPTDKTVDFYSNLGFNTSGYQMYKRY